MGNFLLIAYNFTNLKDLPFEVFMVIFILAVVSAMSFFGLFLRRYQLPTDFKLQYERNVEQVKTDLVQLQGIQRIFSHLGSKFVKDFQKDVNLLDERIKYLKDVLNDQNYDFTAK